MSFVEDILEEVLDEVLEIVKYMSERRLVCPIFQFIHDCQHQMSKNKQESELKRDILDLLEKGADVHEPELIDPVCGPIGYTPILKASEAGASKVVQLLIEKGANVNDKLISGKVTCLHLAVKSNRSQVVNLLVKTGANLDSKTEMTGETPLHIACQNNNPEIAEILMLNGAELNSPTAWGVTPLQLVICNPKSNSLMILKLLIEYGANLEALSNGGLTALLLAVYLGQNEMAKVLLDKGANMNFVSLDGHTPLHCSATKSDLESTKMLIEYGAEANARNHQGNNALEFALQYRSLGNVKLLLFMN